MVELNKLHRDQCALTGSPNLEPVFRIPKMPAYIGCVNTTESDDYFADLSFSICRDCGLIQLDDIPDPKVLYMLPHNDAIGATWHEHHDQFANFVLTHGGERFLEVGGGAGALASLVTSQKPDCTWTLVDPNPVVQSTATIRVVRSFFSEAAFSDQDQFDTVVHSHVLEHVFDPMDFFASIAKLLHGPRLQIFSVPNLRRMLELGYTNCINFEHTLCLGEEFIDAALAARGFTVVAKQRFRDDHSIFYATRYDGSVSSGTFPPLYSNYKPLLLEYERRLSDFVLRTNSAMHAFDGPVFIFGAHIFAQYLLGMGLETESIVGVLDNSPLKIGKRLYGTKLNVFAPDVLKLYPRVAVVLNVAQYRREIVAQLLQLNPATILLE